MQDPTSEEIRKILEEQAHETAETMFKEGYRLKCPRAEWSIANQSLIITKEDGKYEISDFLLQRILNGEEKTSEEEMQLIQEWYQASSYRYGHETDKFTEMLKQAKEKKDDSQIKELETKLKELGDEYRNLSPKDRIKKQLAYTYQESGERLERLYEILYGADEKIEARFGSIKMHITKNAYQESIKEKEYTKSKGFFQDIKNAFEMAKKTQSPVIYSESTGAVYSSEFIFASGEGLLEFYGQGIKARVEIQKDGIKNHLGLLVKIPIDLESDEASQRVRLFLNDYDLEEDGDFWIATNQKAGIRAGYTGRVARGNATLVFGGDPTDLELEINRFMGAVLG